MDTLNVDEMVAQLLVSEGFSTLEEVAYVEKSEIENIEGFDESTSEELQARAQECIEENNNKALKKAKELGVEESLINFEGLNPEMIQVLAEENIKNLEEFAKCADWEIAGGYTTDEGKRVKDEGILEKFDISLKEAKILVMNARLKMGWITAEDYDKEIINEDPVF